MKTNRSFLKAWTSSISCSQTFVGLMNRSRDEFANIISNVSSGWVAANKKYWVCVKVNLCVEFFWIAEVVNPWSKQREYFISCSKTSIEWSLCLEMPKSLSPLEDSEMQPATPLETVNILVAVSPLEANERVEFLEFKMWWHLIPVRISRIPIVVRGSRNKEMNPLGSVFGHAFQIFLIPDKKLEVNCGLQELVLVLTSAVTPSSDEGAPLVLFILVGWIW